MSKAPKERLQLEVRYRREDGVWLAEVADEPRIHTFGRSLAKAREMIVDAAALWHDIDVRWVDIDREHFDVEPELNNRVARALDLRRQASEADSVAAAATRRAADALLDAGFTERDVAAMLGLSHQRIHQLAHAADI